MILNLKSALSSDMLSMINFKVSMGYSEKTFASHCKTLDRFCYENYPDVAVLTEDIVLGWLQRYPDKINILQQRASFIRALSKFIRSTGKAAYILPDKFIPPQKSFTPYIFADNELTTLFSVIDEYSCNGRLDQLQPALFSTLFRLIFTCGLRPGEGRNLLCENVNLDTGEILINATKKHKDRIVIMSDDMVNLAKDYLLLRNIAHPNSPYFFPCKKGTPYTEKMLAWHFRKFVVIANPDAEEDAIPKVRIYDLRHRFATTVMLKWVKDDCNLYNKLPYGTTD